MSKPEDVTSPQDLLKEVRELQREWQTPSRAAHEADYHALQVQAVKDDNNSKKKWSNWLLWILAGTLLSQWILIYLVGFGVMDFSQYQWLLPTLLIQTLAQIVGLAVIVVKSLFQ